ncbi:MAG: NapC/NirT family cytochrome c [Fibrobacteria bacterium]|nr:NapC/NirT family cytochrome c [Fibrobacteria bacterium]
MTPEDFEKHKKVDEMVTGKKHYDLWSKVPGLLQNRISLIGFIITIVFFSLEAFLFAVEFVISSNLYLGLITYVILPPFLFLGLGLIIIGAIIRHRRKKRGIKSEQWEPLKIDFSIPSHRSTTLVAFVAGMILFLASLIGVYKGYHYTETNKFCGTLCHNVMHPEYTAYQQSSHARVHCVECHIGNGADWYVRSKLSGAKQFYSVLFNHFPRPIPTPVANLRPAQETCEQCHWPEKFFGALETQHDYFITDEDSKWDKWKLRMLVKVGGGGMQLEGIHAHMNVAADIYYATEDTKRENITWVKTVSKNGEEKIFTTKDSPYKEKEPPKYLLRKMDCMDCHNRPSHKFEAPYRSLNRSMAYGEISSDIPEIKLKAMAALEQKYDNKETALASIKQQLWDYYREDHTDYYNANKPALTKSINQVAKIYSDNFFPFMKISWKNYPDNIGHLITPGCFRCHDGQHKTTLGETITRDCNACHTIIEQGPPDSLMKSTEGLEFQHPVDIDGEWEDTNCSECHTGGEVE